MHNINDNNYPSKIIGNVHKVLLWIATAIFSIVLVFTLFFYFDVEIYFEYLATIDQAAMTFGSILYYIIVITFLIWIIRVHQAIQRSYNDYPITVGGGIIRMIPIINIWGIGSTFSTIGDYFYRHPALQQTARHIHRLIFPLYIAIFGTNAVNRFLLRNPESITPDMVLFSSILDVASLGVYLWLTILITKGVRELHSNVTDLRGEHEAIETNETQEINIGSTQSTLDS